MPISALTTDEIVATLSRSDLPSIVVEGKDDFAVYRWLERKIDIKNTSVLPCSGRSTLLDVYRRKDEFQSTNVVFVADKDVWLFGEIPEELEGIIWTVGAPSEAWRFLPGESPGRGGSRYDLS